MKIQSLRHYKKAYNKIHREEGNVIGFSWNAYRFLSDPPEVGDYFTNNQIAIGRTRLKLELERQEPRLAIIQNIESRVYYTLKKYFTKISDELKV